MSFSSKLVITGAISGAAITYYVKRRRARSGEGYLAILIQLPSEARRRFTDARRRAALAIEDGRVSARDRANELSRQLAARAALPSGPSPAVYSSQVSGPPPAAGSSPMSGD